MTGTQLLPELAGRDVAKELTYTARIVSGEEAVRLGLATRTDPDPLAAALAMAKEIATRSGRRSGCSTSPGGPAWRRGSLPSRRRSAH